MISGKIVQKPGIRKKLEKTGKNSGQHFNGKIIRTKVSSSSFLNKLVALKLIFKTPLELLSTTSNNLVSLFVGVFEINFKISFVQEF
jgi:hypothetical protein